MAKSIKKDLRFDAETLEEIKAESGRLGLRVTQLVRLAWAHARTEIKGLPSAAKSDADIVASVWDVYHALDASTLAGDKLDAEEVLEALHKALTVAEVKP